MSSENYKFQGSVSQEKSEVLVEPGSHYPQLLGQVCPWEQS